VYDVVNSVGGEDITLHLLMGPGVDPHLYKPTARDGALLRKANAIFYNGLLLEGKLQTTLEKLSGRGKIVRAITIDVPLEQLLEPEDFAGHYDPHVWNDPELWRTTPDVVARELAMLIPDKASDFGKRAATYTSEISAAHEECLEMMKQLTPEQRILITSHDAFNYLGRAYDLKVLAPQGISTVTEAGIADIVETVEFIKANKVKAIFVESSVSPRVIERISSESGAKVGGELFSDAMGDPDEVRTANGVKYRVGTYTGVLRYNIATIVNALK
jgi:manganese/zinc/iron transport system substrate-binding protein